MPAAHVSVECRGQDRAGRGGESGFPLGGQFDTNFARNGLCDIVLKGEHILDVPLVGICPEMAVGPAVDQLRRDLDSRPVADNRALEHGVHAEFTGDLRNLLALVVLVTHD